MSRPDPDDLSSFSMMELFRAESEDHVALLSNGLLELEKDLHSKGPLEELMRAAHSLKGAARIINLGAGVRIAHALEECFVAAQEGKAQLRHNDIDVLFRGVDLLTHLSRCDTEELSVWEDEKSAEIDAFLSALASIPQGASSVNPSPEAEPGTATIFKPKSSDPSGFGAVRTIEPGTVASDTSLFRRQKKELAETRPQISVEGLNRLLGVASESMVESRWVQPFGTSLLRLKRMQADMANSLEALRDSMATQHLSESAEHHFAELFMRITECQNSLSERISGLDAYDRRTAGLSHRLYQEVLQTRMRSFSEAVKRLPRMVRDLGRSLGKDVRLDVAGEFTQVDRDLMARLEAPLAQLLRNAVDHGCEFPDIRRLADKNPTATIHLEARHTTGSLQITVADDGQGLDVARVREVILERKLAPPSAVENMTEAELMDFLFLPGFSLKKTVTELSGRGVGLDVVRNMVRKVRGTIRASTSPGHGMRFSLQLPLSLSVLRVMLFEVAGEPYAIPLSIIHASQRVGREETQEINGRHHLMFRGQHITLISAHRALECRGPALEGGHLSLIILGDGSAQYALVVERFIGERELVMQPLDPRLGKVPDVAAAALMDDGSPVLILDVEELLRRVEQASAGLVLGAGDTPVKSKTERAKKRVLAVDDSLTVRELERKLLNDRGFEAEVAVDGMDGWNALRTSPFDLAIVDVDMPRMDGIELTELIKKDAQLKSMPVMIVSYKDRDEDRLRGLNAGADYFLTKACFHDDTLIRAVMDLIGKPDE